MTAGTLERVIKLIVLAWAIGALALEIRLLRGGWPGLPLFAAAGFITAAVLTAIDRRAVGLVLALAYVFPALVYLWTGAFYPLQNAAWMALLLGAITPAAARTSWHIPGRWRAALIAWSLVTIAGATIVALREIDFTPALFDVTTISNTSRGGWPAFIIRFVLHTALVTVVGILWFDWLSGNTTEGTFTFVAVPLAASAAVLALVAIYQLFVDISLLNHTFYGYLRRATATVFDANIAGTIAALWIGGSLLVADRFGRAAPTAAAVGVTLGWLAVWASGSRTALAAAVIISGFGLIALYASQRRVSPRRAMLSAAAAGGAVAAAVLVLANLPLGVIGPAARLAPAVNDLSYDSMVRTLKEDLWNRNGYGAASTGMIRRYPWFGVGPGSFQSVLPEFAVASGGSLPPDNAQNWYRHQVAELGLIGSLPWIAWIAAFAVHVLRPRRAATPKVWIARGIIVGFAAISWVGMPGQDAAVAVTFWTLAFWFLQISGPPAPRPISPITWAVVAAVLVAHSVGSAYAAKNELRVPVRAYRGEWPYSYGFDPPLPIHGSQGGWAGRHAIAIFESPTRGLSLTVSLDYRRLANPNGSSGGVPVAVRPTDVKVWGNGELLIDRRLTTTAPVSTQVPFRRENRWVFIETWVSRTLRPSDVGLRGDRELGLLVEWTPVASAPRPQAP